MKQIQTLKNKKEFDFVYKNSTKYRSQICDICVLKNKDIDSFYARFKKKDRLNIIGLSVSKKIGKAVERNLIKRRIRAIYSLFLQDFLSSNSAKFIFIIIAKEQIKQTPFLSLKKHIYNTLSSARK
ncbi:ribonuclease P protein component [Helicobacter sp. 16-1353]|uniref:ribonuclease P protein component n=1 Tax=Helicobacter sp. 16-1353 TaxID=2004996 RepID=UPI000DCF01A1|nr:ribonuclease P protein component [Helicobacter sp. 16-1353]RAX53865.1 ribonuclease P protein component [Helicobacter sp. 16-1353]